MDTTSVSTSTTTQEPTSKKPGSQNSIPAPFRPSKAHFRLERLLPLPPPLLPLSKKVLPSFLRMLIFLTLFFAQTHFTCRSSAHPSIRTCGFPAQRYNHL